MTIRCMMPREPTKAMLEAARDWSMAKYGMAIGDEAAVGCWQAMFSAAANPIEQFLDLLEADPAHVERMTEDQLRPAAGAPGKGVEGTGEVGRDA